MFSFIKLWKVTFNLPIEFFQSGIKIDICWSIMKADSENSFLVIFSGKALLVHQFYMDGIPLEENTEEYSLSSLCFIIF